jgi:hypothetical protein
MAKRRKKKGETPLANNIFLPEPLYRREQRGVKTARPDIILDDESLSIDIMQDFIFAEIGGQEILDISRSDLINSPLNQLYNSVKGTGTNFIQQETITFIDGIQNTFASFNRDVDDYRPLDNSIAIVSVDDDTKTLIIKTVNMKTGDAVEIDFLTNIELEDAIIFEGI